jgi:hypothetical protein
MPHYDRQWIERSGRDRLPRLERLLGWLVAAWIAVGALALGVCAAAGPGM